MSSGITPEEHIDYLESGARLMLWFAWTWAQSHPEETFESVTQERTDLRRRTKFNPGHIDCTKGDKSDPGWLETVRLLGAVYDSAAAKNDYNHYENAAMELLRPLMSERVARDLAAIEDRVDVREYQCGSLRLTPPGEEFPRRVSFHIANACYPRSIFEDKNYLPACFIVLMKQAEARYDAEEIATGTWLNSHPKWLELFPREWHDNMSAPDENIRGHYGFWGQFLTARKTFNHKLAKQFMETGKMPFQTRRSWCSIESMRKHLKDKFGI